MAESPRIRNYFGLRVVMTARSAKAINEAAKQGCYLLVRKIESSIPFRLYIEQLNITKWLTSSQKEKFGISVAERLVISYAKMLSMTFGESVPYLYLERVMHCNPSHYKFCIGK